MKPYMDRDKEEFEARVAEAVRLLSEARALSAERRIAAAKRLIGFSEPSEEIEAIWRALTEETQ